MANPMDEAQAYIDEYAHKGSKWSWAVAKAEWAKLSDDAKAIIRRAYHKAEGERSHG